MKKFHKKNIISRLVVNRDYIRPGNIIEFNYTGGTDPKPLVFVLPELDEVKGGGKRATLSKLKKGGSFSGLNLHFLDMYTLERLIKEDNLRKLRGWVKYKQAYRTYSIKSVRALKLIEFKTNKQLSEERKVDLGVDLNEPEPPKQPELPKQPEPPPQPEKPKSGG